MWKYIYICLVCMALFIAVLSKFVNSDKAAGGAINSMLSKLGVQKQQTYAKKIVGQTSAQTKKLRDLEEEIEMQKRIFDDQQRIYQDQLLKINTDVQLSSERFMTIFSDYLDRDLEDANRENDLKLQEQRQKMQDMNEKLAMLKDQLNQKSSLSENVNQNIDDILGTLRAENLYWDSFNPGLSDQYEQSLTKLEQLKNQREQVVEQIKASSEQMRINSEQNMRRIKEAQLQNKLHMEHQKEQLRTQKEMIQTQKDMIEATRQQFQDNQQRMRDMQQN